MNWFMQVFAQLKPPASMTQEEFMGYHQTGYIPPYREDTHNLENYNAPDEYHKPGWYSKERAHILVDTQEIDGMLIEFRMKDEDNKYVKLGPPDNSGHGDILRDEQGMALYHSEQEMREMDLPLKDTTIYMFHGDKCIGHIGDSFGATELFIAQEYKGHGIGTAALKVYMEMNPSKSHKTPRLGQMTSPGSATATKVWMKFVEDAIARGEQLRPEVLKSYEDTKKMRASDLWRVQRE